MSRSRVIVTYAVAALCARALLYVVFDLDGKPLSVILSWESLGQAFLPAIASAVLAAMFVEATIHASIRSLFLRIALRGSVVVLLASLLHSALWIALALIVRAWSGLDMRSEVIAAVMWGGLVLSYAFVPITLPFGVAAAYLVERRRVEPGERAKSARFKGRAHAV